MVRITEQLVRKRAEHNEGLISTLEELTLHQEGVEKLEYLDKWCRDLKILYLQNNLIPKIENVSKLKKLEYLNLTLNNITEIENLEGCESLAKLDLTINFIWKLTTVESLADNYNLKQLFLVGNPCAEYEGYRSFVIGTLPQLKALDGLEITRTERYEAKKELSVFKKSIIEQQETYAKNISVDENHNEKSVHENKGDYWTTPSEYTPESRVKAHEYVEALKKDRTKTPTTEPKKERRLFSKDGTPYNINQPKLDFKLTEDELSNFILEIKLFRYLDTSDVSVDLEPSYVRLRVKGKVFQLVLPENVHPDKSKAERSRATGKLTIRMPKTRYHEVLRSDKFEIQKAKSKDNTTVKVEKITVDCDETYPEDMPKLI